MSDVDDDLSLEDLLDRFRGSIAEEIHTAVPGRVESYDAAAQVADVTPMVRRSMPRADGTRASETLPTIRAVPILWPRAGSWFVHMPLAAGDFVLLVMCERDPARWRVTGELSDPIDRRSHHLSHAIGIPGVYPRTKALAPTSTPADALVLGRESGATIRIQTDGEVVIDASLFRFGGVGAVLVALSTLVDARIAALQLAHDTHTHLYSPGPLPPVVTAPPVPLAGPQASTAATKTRAE